MRLNHLNLTVTDVPAAADFLETYFGLRRGEGAQTSKSFAMLFDDDGLVLTLMKAAHGEEIRYPGTFHIGFGQPSEERVNEINQRLKDDGFNVAPPQRSHAWTFYVQAPGGFMVEVMA
ncbi:MAG: VOC family protein [Ktedonobacterales bacterium]|jgi:catechol 2,3-dioxygenase-like lactoylglutathione lyase family enzyme